MKKDEALLLGKNTATVECVAGIAWLTSAGDSRDVAIRAGETITVQGRKRLCAGALTDAVLSVAVRGGDERRAPIPRAAMAISLGARTA